MENKKMAFNTIDEYISAFPHEVQETLQQLRAIIKASAPNAEEKMSWQMPTFALYGNVVHFAAYKKHIGFYPAPSGIEAFKPRLSEYKTSKGAVQFSIGKPLPYELISEIVKYRVAENIKQAESKLKKDK